MQLLWVVAMLGVVTAECPASLLQTISTCYAPYLRFFGVSAGKNLPVPSSWQVPREQMYQKDGRNAIFPVCSNTWTLADCLRKNLPVPRECYEALGLSAADASNYQTDVMSMEFQCTTGIDALYNNFDCYRSAAEHYQAQFEQCTADYGKNVRVDVCKAMNGLMDCRSSIYGKACGDQLKALTCGISRVALNLVDPTCDADGKLNKCPAPN
ncbi:unnamed protein product, partial [Mesorhabditis spiculigera]